MHDFENIWLSFDLTLTSILFSPDLAVHFMGTLVMFSAYFMYICDLFSDCSLYQKYFNHCADLASFFKCPEMLFTENLFAFYQNRSISPEVQKKKKSKKPVKEKSKHKR